MDLILKWAPKGQHMGFEPIPQMYQDLVTKYAQNPHVDVCAIAASNAKGEATFNHVISNPAYSGLQKRSYDRPEERDTQITVQTDLLDNVVPEGRKIDLIKIDVEGGEMLVLEGARKLMARHKPLVVFEHGLGASDHYGSFPDKMFAYFAGFEMGITTLSGFLKRQPGFTQAEFEAQYFEKRNYYFVAFSMD